MIATANSISYTNAKPMLIDSESNTWNMDVNKIEKNITEKTKVIMPVHTYGHPVDMDVVNYIADKYDLFIIEDAAEAHGALYKGRKIGSISDLSCFSFYANKIITTGEGGIIVTNNKDLAEKAKWLRAHAYGREGKHFYHEAIGFGYRLSGLQAALGLSQLSRIDKFISIRRRNAKLYEEYLSGLEEKITLHPEASWAKNVYWMYSILVNDEFGLSRNNLMKKLMLDGIETRTFFYPIHVQPIYYHIAIGKKFPVADNLSQKGINLPSGNTLTSEEIQYVCECIIKHSEGR